jgi:hypothetical protein
VYNFTGGCSVSWDAMGREQDGQLDVVLTNPSWNSSACGNCVYDAAFSLELGTSTSDTIELIDQPCGDYDERTLGEWQVPASDGGSTVSCGFARRAGARVGAEVMRPGEHAVRIERRVRVRRQS